MYCRSRPGFRSRKSRRVRILGGQENSAEFLYEALDYVGKCEVKVIGEAYPLAEIGRADDRAQKGQVHFRAVITN